MEQSQEIQDSSWSAQEINIFLGKIIKTGNELALSCKVLFLWLSSKQRYFPFVLLLKPWKSNSLGGKNEYQRKEPGGLQILDLVASGKHHFYNIKLQDFALIMAAYLNLYYLNFFPSWRSPAILPFSHKMSALSLTIDALTLKKKNCFE